MCSSFQQAAKERMEQFTNSIQSIEANYPKYLAIELKRLGFSTKDNLNISKVMRMDPSNVEENIMAKKAVYVVFKGRQPGIYSSWPECQEQVNDSRLKHFWIFFFLYQYPFLPASISIVVNVCIVFVRNGHISKSSQPPSFVEEKERRLQIVALLRLFLRFFYAEDDKEREGHEPYGHLLKGAPKEGIEEGINKKEREKVREVGILKKDPEKLREQIDKLNVMTGKRIFIFVKEKGISFIQQAIRSSRLNETIHANYASTSPKSGLKFIEFPETRTLDFGERMKLLDAQRSLHLHLKPDGSSLLSFYLAKPYGCNLIFRVSFTMALWWNESTIRIVSCKGFLDVYYRFLICFFNSHPSPTPQALKSTLLSHYPRRLPPINAGNHLQCTGFPADLPQMSVASTLVWVVVFVFGLVAFALAVAAEQRRTTVNFSFDFSFDTLVSDMEFLDS
ncbi:hypothetical protein FNV43_RR13398 [Rhamnella rubrinervis]|uniref:Uncharacterized protein n=1 Tax=Rhamnella rubrinervis TaxID=2594499 RepID=A0A8K0MFA7_9ROSA|nr:hypothetical protein FNV43_RR13398 [Rhamnella rubrinervis]